MTYVMSLARILCHKSEVTVAAPASSRLLAEARTARRAHHRAGFMGRPLLESCCALRRLRTLLRDERFDVVHVNGSADHRLCMLATMGMGARRPFIVYTQHTDRSANSLPARARQVGHQSRHLRMQPFRRMKQSVFRNEDLRMVHNGVDTEKCRPATQRQAAQARDSLLPDGMQGRLVIGSNAGTAIYKNWLDMVAAVSSLPAPQRRQVVILIAGKLPDAEQMRRVEELGMADQVVLHGFAGRRAAVPVGAGRGFVLSSRWRRFPSPAAR